MRGVNVVSLAIALGAGVLSITSPCCLPLLPGYLGYLTGLSATELGENRRRTMFAAGLFVAGFSAVFIALGATASEVGALLLHYRLPATRLAGVFILTMGLLLLLGGRIGLLSQGGHWARWSPAARPWMAPVLGAAFAMTWTPCIGPVLAAILTLAGSTADLRLGVALLTAYSVGLGLPFLALGLSVTRVRYWLRGIGRGTVLIQGATGTLLVAMGVLLLTDRWLPLVAPVLAWYAHAQWPPL